MLLSSLTGSMPVSKPQARGSTAGQWQHEAAVKTGLPLHAGPAARMAAEVAAIKSQAPVGLEVAEPGEDKYDLHLPYKPQTVSLVRSGHQASVSSDLSQLQNFACLCCSVPSDLLAVLAGLMPDLLFPCFCMGALWALLNPVLLVFMIGDDQANLKLGELPDHCPCRLCTPSLPLSGRGLAWACSA